MKTIVFDETCIGWSEIPEHNERYLRLQREHLNDLLIYRRYLYLNVIYESFGVKWNPDDKNICYLAEFGPIGIEFQSIGEGKYLVHID